VGVSIRFNANIHPAPLDHNAFVICGFDSPTKSQKGNVAGAAVFVLAVEPLAVQGLGLWFSKPHF